MATPIRCSIIINTYNRVSHLARLLASFHHLTYEQFEVVVVNGPSTDETAALLTKYQERIKVVDCPVAHMTRSRNLGLATASGDIVIFIDDDALPARPTWLDEIVATFEADKTDQIGAVGGPVFHQDTDHFQFKGGLVSDYCQQIFWEQDRGNTIPDGSRWVPRSMGCNSAFRRAALLEIGGFDENIGYYADESDVCLRLARQGYQIVQPENCAVRHYPAQSRSFGAPFLRNRAQITHDDTYFCLKNGGDSRLRRLLKTLWLAPQKHFVTEMPQLRRAGQVSTGQLLRFWGWQWPRGLAAGLWHGLFTPRQTNFRADDATEFVPFKKAAPVPKRHICLITENVPPYNRIGGVERYTYDLARALHELGHEVHLICQSEQPLRRDGLGFLLHGIPQNAYHTQILFPGMPVLNQTVGYALAVAKQLVELSQSGVQIDVVHATNWNLCGLSLPLMRIFPYLLVIVSPLAEVIETQAWPYTDDLRAAVALDRWQIEQACTLLCPSWGVLSAYRDKMGLDVDRLPVEKVQLGIVPSLLLPQPRAADEPYRLLFVGRLEYRKGAHILLETLPDLLSANPNWHCDLVGDDQVPDTDNQTLKAKFLGKHSGAEWLNRVHFHGAVSDDRLQEFYRRCDLFVAPSLFESFGIIYPEAMQYGKPVVGCRVAGIPEIVTAGVDGLLVEPGSVSALRAALQQLMNDPALREQLGQAGLKKVQETLNYRAMARRLLVRYEAVIAEHGEAWRQKLPRRLNLFDTNEVRRMPVWQQQIAGDGQTYLTAANSGAELSFAAPSNSLITLTTLRHNWSGILQIIINDQPVTFVDLYSPHSLPEAPFRFRVNGDAASIAQVVLRINPEKNPESFGSQIWVKGIGIQPASP